MSAPLADALGQGVDHFNGGRYFEAHEAWEALWLRERGPLADFYKGLIQCAAALLHVRRGNLAGAHRLYDRQRSALSRYAPDTLGISVADLLADMDALFARLAGARPGQAPEPEVPALPKIVWRPGRG